MTRHGRNRFHAHVVLERHGCEGVSEGHGSECAAALLFQDSLQYMQDGPGTWGLLPWTRIPIRCCQPCISAFSIRLSHPSAAAVYDTSPLLIFLVLHHLYLTTEVDIVL